MLQPMSDQEFDEYRKIFVQDYSRLLSDSADRPLEMTTKEADTIASQMKNNNGEDNDYKWRIVDTDRNVKIGYLWVGTDAGFNSEEHALGLADIYMEQRFRGQGYGARVMAQLEVTAREMGQERIHLGVQAHNQAAIALYEKAGFQVHALDMCKKL